MRKNLAWALTRHHNLGQVARIALEESKELKEVGMDNLAGELLELSGKAESVRLALENIAVLVPTTVGGNDA